MRATVTSRFGVSIHGEALQGEDDALINGPKLTVRREASGLRVKGEGCDELTTFVAGPPSPSIPP